MEYSKQLNLPLNLSCELYEEPDYIIGSSNKAAFDCLITHAQDWPNYCAILQGPNGSGKTHLARIWQRRNHATMLKAPCKEQLLHGPCVIENIDSIKEHQELLHCINLSKEQGNKLLLTSAALPVAIPIKLADLRSRLQALPLLKLSDPDDQLLNIILAKQFVSRQLKVKPAILNYILSHCKRSVPFIRELVATIDDYTLETKSAVTINSVKRALNNILQ